MSNGRYCGKISYGTDKIKGREIILEDLREKCIYANLRIKKMDYSAWWIYMEHVHKLCYHSITEDCSRLAH